MFGSKGESLGKSRQMGSIGGRPGALDLRSGPLSKRRWVGGPGSN